MFYFLSVVCLAWDLVGSCFYILIARCKWFAYFMLEQIYCSFLFPSIVYLIDFYVKLLIRKNPTESIAYMFLIIFPSIIYFGMENNILFLFLSEIKNDYYSFRLKTRLTYLRCPNILARYQFIFCLYFSMWHLKVYRALSVPIPSTQFSLRPKEY